MAENYYDDGPEAGPESASKQEVPEGQGKDEGEKTYVLPKEVLMGKDFKPGDELVLKVTAIHDDQIEVTYAPEKPKEDEGKSEMAEGPESGSPGGGEMASMME